MSYSDYHPPISLDTLNQLIKEYCDQENEKRNTTGFLTLNSTFKEVAEYLNLFASFEVKYNQKKTSPDFESALKFWIKEIELKLDCGNRGITYLHGDFNSSYRDIDGKTLNDRFNIQTYVYLQTINVEKSYLATITPYLFSSNFDAYRDMDEYDFVIKFHSEKLLQIGRGYVYANKLPLLKKELKDLSRKTNNTQTMAANDATKSVENIDENLLRFDSVAQKYLLLHELGIIDFLKNKFPNMKNKKQGLLLAYITDTKSIKSFENILSQIANVNGEHYPFKERNEIKVTNILDQIGISKQIKIEAVKVEKKK